MTKARNAFYFCHISVLYLSLKKQLLKKRKKLLSYFLPYSKQRVLFCFNLYCVRIQRWPRLLCKIVSYELMCHYHKLWLGNFYLFQVLLCWPQQNYLIIKMVFEILRFYSYIATNYQSNMQIMGLCHAWFLSYRINRLLNLSQSIVQKKNYGKSTWLVTFVSG